ncbi:MAG: helix-turn-helix transcriptional regulator [Clostridia bacterium]|nr:helix-turn-helix transcriptional regulator [Clostridia bacterium]
MIYKDWPFGQAKITGYLPTRYALKYLNCCTTAGWHRCNDLYVQEYKDSVNELLVIYTLNGAGKMELGGKTYTLCKDSFIFVSPHTPMKYYTDPQVGVWEFYWLNLTGDKTFFTTDKLWHDGYFFFRKLANFEHIFTDLFNESLSETARSELIEKILDRVISEAFFTEEQSGSVVNNILLYISEHYKEKIDIYKLSAQFYLSQNQIIRIVRTRTGYTPHEYLSRFRLAKACELLQCTETPVAEIGNAVGYDNSSHFSASFRRLYGITPTEYRARFSR